MGTTPSNSTASMTARVISEAESAPWNPVTTGTTFLMSDATSITSHTSPANLPGMMGFILFA